MWGLGEWFEISDVVVANAGHLIIVSCLLPSNFLPNWKFWHFLLCWYQFYLIWLVCHGHYWNIFSILIQVSESWLIIKRCRMYRFETFMTILCPIIGWSRVLYHSSFIKHHLRRINSGFLTNTIIVNVATLAENNVALVWFFLSRGLQSTCWFLLPPSIQFPWTLLIQ